jgi:hypothetical protein
MLDEPRSPLADIRRRAAGARLLQHHCHETRGITVARRVERRGVGALPRPERRHGPPAIVLLLTGRRVDDGLTLDRREESRELRGRPQHHDPVEQGFRVSLVPQVAAEQLQRLLNVGARRVSARCTSDGEGRKSSAVVRRARRFPRLVVEIQPGPRPFQVAGLELQRPQVTECLPGVAAQNAGWRIAHGQNQRVQDRLRSPRLARFRQTAGLIRIERFDLVPQLHALGDVRQQSAFRCGQIALLQRSVKRRPCQGVRDRRMAGHTGRLVIPRGGGPMKPPVHSAIEVGGGSLRIPRRRRRAQMPRVRDHQTRDEAQGARRDTCCG